MGPGFLAHHPCLDLRKLGLEICKYNHKENCNSVYRVYIAKYNTYHFGDETHPHLIRYSQASKRVSEESKNVSSKTQELQSTRNKVKYPLM